MSDSEMIDRLIALLNEKSADAAAKRRALDDRLGPQDQARWMVELGREKMVAEILAAIAAMREGQS
jgi:hypothetical protein